MIGLNFSGFIFFCRYLAVDTCDLALLGSLWLLWLWWLWWLLAEWAGLACLLPPSLGTARLRLLPALTLSRDPARTDSLDPIPAAGMLGSATEIVLSNIH